MRKHYTAAAQTDPAANGLQHVGARETFPPLESRVPLSHALLGRDLPPLAVYAVLLLLLLQVSLHFWRFNNQPIATAPGAAHMRQFYPASLRFQNVDTPGWVLTGLMLPGNAPDVRAMRPLYPLIVTFAARLGLVPLDARIKTIPAGMADYRFAANSYWPAVRVLQVANACLATLSGWLFFALARRFGLQAPAALCATIAAGSGFGWCFMVVQATPDVFGYTAIIVTFVALTLACEFNPAAPRPVCRTSQLHGGLHPRTVVVWGCVGILVGILLLGKEIFNLPIFIGLFLVFTRRWLGLLAFSVLVLLPALGWNYYMAHVVKAFSPAEYLQKYKFVIWLWQDLGPLTWAQRADKLWHNLSTQIRCLGEAFAYVPVLLAAIGLAVGHGTVPRRGLLVGCFLLSLYCLFLASNFVMPRLMFYAWPVVYFFAWVAVERCINWIENLAHAGQESFRLVPLGAANSAIAWSIRLAVLAGLVYLGTRDHFNWFNYG